MLRKKQTTPTGLKVGCTVLILLMVISCAMSVYLFLRFQSYSVQNSNNFKYISKLSVKLDSQTMMSLLTAISNFNITENGTQLIMEQVAISNKLLNEMYELNPNII